METEVETSVQVKFTVDVKAPVATKGLDAIDATSLMVLAYDTDGTFLKELPILKTAANAAGQLEFLCGFDLQLPADAAVNAPEYKFVVLTNSTNKQYGLSYRNGVPDIESLDFAYPFQNTVPMWGVKTFTLQFEDGEPAQVQQLGIIDVLRSAAKVGVKLSESVKEEGYTIEGLKINYVAGSGYSVPAKWDEVDQTAELNNTEGFRPMAGVIQENVSSFKVSSVVEGMHYIYIPEIENEEELAISVVLKKGNDVFEFPYEKGIKFRTYLEGQPTDQKFNVVRNHFYDYTITAVHTNIEIELIEYTTLPFIEEEVEIGGDLAYLVLNTDLVKIYSENVDETTLKFTSSSPIASIVLKDSYSHDVATNRFEEGTDEVSAYYVGKFGQKTQLGKDPGFDIADKDAALAREEVILNNISATYPEYVLNGGVTINSPFIADPTKELPELQQDSHYDTPRYLEFLVTNEQGLTATFRVIQYPPVVITNKEGFFSYRDDFCEGHHELGTNKPAVHWLNYQEVAYVLAFLQNTEIHQVDPLLVDKFGNDYAAISSDPGSQYTFKELLLADGGNGGWYKSSVYPYGEFIRKFYENMGKQSQNQLVGVPYYDPNYVHPDPSTINAARLEAIKGTDRDNWWRKHYTGNMIEFFMSKVIKQVYRNGIEDNGMGIKRLPGQADIYHHMPDGKGGWRLMNRIVNVNTMQFNNNRMYHIKTQQVTDKYIIGYPKVVEGDSVLVENRTNANLVSPSFMVASQLGTTEMPVNDHPGIYEDASPQMIYDMAKIHCKQYVETTFEDTNGNGIPEPELGEKVTYYHNWRLPTKAEIDLIIEYQNASRAMDLLLTGQRYACVTGEPGKLFSEEVEGYTNNGYFMRCVRDVHEE
jgi:hypothetical protein